MASFALDATRRIQLSIAPPTFSMLMLPLFSACEYEPGVVAPETSSEYSGISGW
jgi:hypothetical protein